MIAVAIADPALLAGAKANDERLAKLADPRTIKLDDATARKLVDQSYPVYYITGTIHSPETGAPTALMELGLSPCGRQCALHQVDPLAHDYADYASGGSGWPRPHGRFV